MPIREYKCTRCHKRFEKILRGNQDLLYKNGQGTECSCGYLAVPVVSTPSPAKFKGSGFYQTDYKN